MKNIESNNLSSENLQRLAQFLNYELSASVLFFLSFFNAIALIIAGIAAGLFAPYMLYVLLKENRRSWIIIFIILIIFPLLFSLILFREYFTIFLLLSMAMFYFYCFMLRMAVSDWIKDSSWKIAFLLQKKEKNKRQLNSEDSFKM
ncbi:MAG: hypothetical protein MUP85_10970 [Candidatus Lokiarchaeota archaeon]|nr:hypothetical protein [Candidatus Lokiarchaeota archaeon]